MSPPPASSAPLHRLLARALACSRREATAALRAGRVRDGEGKVLADPDMMLAAGALPRTVRFDDRALELHDEHHRLLHKPRGYVTARAAGHHPTAYELLVGAPLHADLRPIGRLDLDCTGLLLWTTVGPLVQWIAHPRRAIPRIYHVALARPYADDRAQAAIEGHARLVLADGSEPSLHALEPLARESVHPALGPVETDRFAAITLTAGSYHEVKRTFAALGSHVLALCRVAVGTPYARLALPADLGPGKSVAVDLRAYVEAWARPAPDGERAAAARAGGGHREPATQGERARGGR